LNTNSSFLGNFLGVSLWGISHVCRQGNYVYLQDLFAAPELRGKGVGRALIDHVYAVAKAQGDSRVWWLTHETNTDAMHLYDKVADKSDFIQYRKLMN